MTMDPDTASRFVSSLIQSIQALCHGYVQFSSSIEVVGHIYLNVDKGLKFNYIVNEEVNKDPVDLTTVFHTNSYHSLPPNQLRTEVSIGCAKNTDIVPSTITPITFSNKDSKSYISSSKTCFDVEKVKTERDQLSSSASDAVLPGHKAPAVSPTRHRYKRKKLSKLSCEQPENGSLNLNSHVVIKREADEVYSDNGIIVTNIKSGEEHTVEEHPLGVGESCEHASDIANGDPYPVKIHKTLDDIEIGQLACNVAAFQAGGVGDILNSGAVNSSKSLMAHFRHQIVEYANIVGNRPAARHFGVHESSIRHWRKKFGMALQGPGGRRGRRRCTSFPHFNSNEVLIPSHLERNSSASPDKCETDAL